jgi:hypothetical protein
LRDERKSNHNEGDAMKGTLTLDTAYTDGQCFTLAITAEQAPTIARALTNGIHDHTAVSSTRARLVSFAIHR